MEYQSYLLLIWRPDPQTDWHYILEFVSTGERHSFDQLADVFTFLQRTQPTPLRHTLPHTAYGSIPA
jgi:hypothetical protein